MYIVHEWTTIIVNFHVPNQCCNNYRKQPFYKLELQGRTYKPYLSEVTDDTGLGTDVLPDLIALCEP